MPKPNWFSALKAELEKRHLEEALYHRKHGDVKQIISAEFNGYRFVASGKKLIYSKSFRVFPDFLNNHLHNLLGTTWGQDQVKLPFEQQHPIVQWRTIWTTAASQSQRASDGLYSSKSGAAMAWFRLAYDLYLIEHNANLQSKLLRRLRLPENFQGARFEAAVAAMMLASGYELQYAAEIGPGKHPEFLATHQESKHVIAVEAKSRHRPGVLGFAPNEPIERPSSFGIEALLLSALRKNTKDPLLIFIELNFPLIIEGNLELSKHATDELNEAWERVQALPWEGGFPSIGVVFYNDASAWFLKDDLPVNGAAIWALTMWPTNSRHQFDSRPLLVRIAKGCLQRCNIPGDFPAQ